MSRLPNGAGAQVKGNKIKGNERGWVVTRLQKASPCISKTWLNNADISYLSTVKSGTMSEGGKKLSTFKIKSLSNKIQ